MRRQDVTLVMLALAEGQPYTPVQIQKAMFLAADKVMSAFDADSRYDFKPYDYGPFDKNVYLDIEKMEVAGLTAIETSSSGWSTYSATDAGNTRARELMAGLKPGEREMLQRISTVVRSMSFSQLVSAVYKAYPHMRERSVFRE